MKDRSFLTSFINSTVLITGGSSGIGKAAAGILAKHNCRLILTSENAEDLEKAKKEIELESQRTIEIIVKDLSSPGSGRELYRTIAEMKIEVDVFIYSAGIHSSIEKEYNDVGSVQKLLHLHMNNLTELLLLISSDMKKRNRGYILTISSITSWFSDPASLIYGPSKSFISTFSRSLHCDLKEYGIHVTCLKPGGVNTKFFSHNNVYIPPFVKKHLLSSEECAKKGLRALERGKISLIPGFAAKQQLLLYFLCMRPIFYTTMKKLYLRKKTAGRVEQ